MQRTHGDPANEDQLLAALLRAEERRKARRRQGAAGSGAAALLRSGTCGRTPSRGTMRSSFAPSPSPGSARAPAPSFRGCPAPDAAPPPPPGFTVSVPSPATPLPAEDPAEAQAVLLAAGIGVSGSAAEPEGVGVTSPSPPRPPVPCEVEEIERSDLLDTPPLSPVVHADAASPVEPPPPPRAGAAPPAAEHAGTPNSPRSPQQAGTPTSPRSAPQTGLPSSLHSPPHSGRSTGSTTSPRTGEPPTSVVPTLSAAAALCAAVATAEEAAEAMASAAPPASEGRRWHLTEDGSWQPADEQLEEPDSGLGPTSGPSEGWSPTTATAAGASSAGQSAAAEEPLHASPAAERTPLQCDRPAAPRTPPGATAHRASGVARALLFSPSGSECRGGLALGAPLATPAPPAPTEEGTPAKRKRCSMDAGDAPPQWPPLGPPQPVLAPLGSPAGRGASPAPFACSVPLPFDMSFASPTAAPQAQCPGTAATGRRRYDFPGVLGVAEDLYRLARRADAPVEDDGAGLRRLLERRFELAREGAGGDEGGPTCVLTRARTPGAPDGDSSTESANRSGRCGAAATGEFGSMEAVAEAVNVADGALCRLLSAASRRPQERAVMRCALDATGEALREAEGALRYELPPRAEGTALPPAPATAADKSEAALEALRAAAQAATGPVHSAAKALLEKASGLGPAVAAPLAGAAGEVVAAVRAAQQQRLEGSGAGRGNEGGSGSLAAALSELKLGADDARCGGRLAQAAEMRRSALRLQEEWLLGAAAAPPAPAQSAGVARAAAAAEAATEPLRRAVGTFADTCREQRAEAAALGESLAAAQQRRGELRAAAAAAAQLSAEQLQENTRQAERVLDELDRLHQELCAVFQQRAQLLRGRIEAAGCHCMLAAEAERACEESAAALCAAQQQCVDGNAADELQEAAQALLCAARDAAREAALQQEEAERERDAAREAEVERVWHRYCTDQGDWAAIIERGVAAQEGRKRQAEEALAEAEERYDEADRDGNLLLRRQAAERLQQLRRERDECRGSFIRCRDRVVEYFRHARHVAWTSPPSTPAPDVQKRSHAPRASPVPAAATPAFPRAGAERPEGTVLSFPSPPDPSPGEATPSTVAQDASPAPSKPLAEVVRELGRGEAATARWLAVVEHSDIATVGDLERVRSVPSVWESFFAEHPLLKTELELYLRARTPARPHGASPQPSLALFSPAASR
eukprot:TRINITY_DN7562_c0_g1_i2.p1 TRINITY_DN7562_c0_g1~~TRINITY_DN7562_c0_g1_i2.p1  ORF type:complete len:1212 (+),score=324.72 TRINITY_DN7562_c0_g1_i2:103-3738(+)